MQAQALDFSQLTYCKGCDEYHDHDGWYYRKDGTKRCKARSLTSGSESQKRRLATVREYQREYRLRKKGDARWRALQKAREARHKKANPESAADKTRRWRLRHPENQLWRGARERAEKKGIEFALTREWVLERIQAGRCELTGLEFRPNETPGRCGPFAPSIDRIDAARGYTSDNCRLICWGLNMAFSEWGEEVYAHLARAYLER